uniref:Uncharacterized protein n=1 Tax=viral metagenome TaxID=1070528 RepID=A0A6C0JRW2_9ZZZZ
MNKFPSVCYMAYEFYLETNRYITRNQVAIDKFDLINDFPTADIIVTYKEIEMSTLEQHKLYDKTYEDDIIPILYFIDGLPYSTINSNTRSPHQIFCVDEIEDV